MLVEVLPSLYLGPRADIPEPAEEDVVVAIGCSPRWGTPRGNDVVLPGALDDPSEVSFTLSDLIVSRAITGRLSSERRLFVHCVYGHSRSVVAVLQTLLLASAGASLASGAPPATDACSILHWFAGRYSGFFINPGFVRQTAALAAVLVDCKLLAPCACAANGTGSGSSGSASTPSYSPLGAPPPAPVRFVRGVCLAQSPAAPPVGSNNSSSAAAPAAAPAAFLRLLVAACQRRRLGLPADGFRAIGASSGEPVFETRNFLASKPDGATAWQFTMHPRPPGIGGLSTPPGTPIAGGASGTSIEEALAAAAAAAAAATAEAERLTRLLAAAVGTTADAGDGDDSSDSSRAPRAVRPFKLLNSPATLGNARSVWSCGACRTPLFTDRNLVVAPGEAVASEGGLYLIEPLTWMGKVLPHSDGSSAAAWLQPLECATDAPLPPPSSLTASGGVSRPEPATYPWWAEMKDVAATPAAPLASEGSGSGSSSMGLGLGLGRASGRLECPSPACRQKLGGWAWAAADDEADHHNHNHHNHHGGPSGRHLSLSGGGGDGGGSSSPSRHLHLSLPRFYVVAKRVVERPAAAL